MFFESIKCRKSRKAQVWVETVIYTLIGLAVIGLMLAVAKPKIDEMKDKLAIEQSIESLNKVDAVIRDIGVPGNRRQIDLKVGKGRFIIDNEEDIIYWIMDSKYKYSEPGIDVPLGDMDVLTSNGSPWTVRLLVNYSGIYDLQFNSQVEGEKEFVQAPSPYPLFVENLGDGVINIREA